MNTEENQDGYKLIFEGPVDDTLPTLQRIKGALIADLNLSVDEAKQALSNLPALLKVANTETDLSAFYEKLKRAGAKVLIVKPHAEEVAATTSEEVESNDIEPDTTASAEGIEFVLELDDMTPAPKTTTTEKAAKVYEIDESDDLALMDEIALQELKGLSSNDEETEQELSLDLSSSEGSTANELNLDSDENNNITSNLEIDLKDDAPAISQPTVAEEELSLNFEDSTPQNLELDEEDQDETLSSSQTNLEIESESAPLIPKENNPPISNITTDTNSPVLPQHKPVESEVAKIRPTSNKNVSEDDAYIVSSPHLTHRRSQFLELFLFSLSGIFILGVFNWLYFANASKPKLPIPELPPVENVMPDPADHVDGIRSLQVVSKIKIFDTTINSADQKVSCKLVTNDGKIISIKFNFSAPAPAQLTPLEIVQGKAKAPWLFDLELRTSNIIEENGLQIARNVPVKAYIDDGKTKIRVVGKGQFSANYLRERGVYKVKATVLNGFDSMPDKHSLTIQKTENGNYRLAVEADIEVAEAPLANASEVNSSTPAS